MNLSDDRLARRIRYEKKEFASTFIGNPEKILEGLARLMSGSGFEHEFRAVLDGILEWGEDPRKGEVTLALPRGIQTRMFQEGCTLPGGVYFSQPCNAVRFGIDFVWTKNGYIPILKSVYPCYETGIFA